MVVLSRSYFIYYAYTIEKFEGGFKFSMEWAGGGNWNSTEVTAAAEAAEEAMTIHYLHQTQILKFHLGFSTSEQ